MTGPSPDFSLEELFVKDGQTKVKQWSWTAKSKIEK